MSVDISGVDLTGQVAIVTGGPFELSYKIALALESAGSAVALIVKTEHELNAILESSTDTNGRVWVMVADSPNRNIVMQTVQNYREQLGFITLVVNVVGMTKTHVPLWQVDIAEWSSTLEATLRGSLLWTKAAIREMSNGGTIINIADPSIFSLLTNSFAAEANARGIKMFSIDPVSEFMRESVVQLAGAVKEQ